MSAISSAQTIFSSVLPAVLFESFSHPGLAELALHVIRIVFGRTVGWVRGLFYMGGCRSAW